MESFREVQQYRRVWYWVVAFPISIFATFFILYGMYRQLVLHEPFGSNPVPDTVLAVTGPAVIIVVIGLSVLFAFTKLITAVDDAGLHITYIPFLKKTIAYADIKRCEAITYRPMLEYGGWGIRYGGKKKRAYSIRGNRGVQLELKGSLSLLIGSGRPDELSRAVVERL